MISSVESMGMGSILSDHVPLSFLLHLDCASVPVYTSPNNSNYCIPDWSNVSPTNIENFQSHS